MTLSAGSALSVRPKLPKAATGISGFDEITEGGLPRGRASLVCGGPGCGKTLFAVEFLINGARQFGEPGVFVSFEESPDELSQNVASLGYDLPGLEQQQLLRLDWVRVDPNQIFEAGDYNLEGLFIRLGHAIDSIRARRVALDTLEALFGGLQNESLLRNELDRLFRWLKERGVTTVITAERGDGVLTRRGLEEYVSDCVILLEHRVEDLVSTRRLRVVKYRGSTHGTNDYPFLIDEGGFSVLPLTSLRLDHEVTDERISTGVPRLDEMLGGQGVHRGSSVLISGHPGTGKTSLASRFVVASCERGERALYFAYEESPQQILRNMRSVGANLQKWIDRGLLQAHAARPTLYGLEMHLVSMHKAIEAFSPRLVVLDPITNFTSAGAVGEVKNMLMRLIDYLKVHQITAVLTSLTAGDPEIEPSDIGVSSLMDTWLMLRHTVGNGERNRTLSVVKSRGTAHSNQIREFILSERGVELIDAYLGPSGVLTGAARMAQESRETEDAAALRESIERSRRDLERRRRALDAHLQSLQAEFELQEEELMQTLRTQEGRSRSASEEREIMGRARTARGGDRSSKPQTVNAELDLAGQESTPGMGGEDDQNG